MMSLENVELHRALYRTFGGPDAEALVSLCEPEIRIRSVFAQVGGVELSGHEGARRWHRDLRQAWGGEFRVEAKTYYDLGERTLMFGVLHGRGEHSGIEVTMPGFGVATWREGLCASHFAYPEKDELLEAVGVNEGDLEPIAP